VGPDTLDDAAVVRWPRSSAPDAPLLVQTVDVIAPIVDDPYEFGAVAAANALSDIYAMGATPRLALNVAAFPRAKLPVAVLRDILRGGAETVIAAGAMVAGGHTIDDDVPKYGLVVTGEVAPGDLVTNAGGRPGDVLVLTKALGTGLLAGAVRRGDVAPEALAALVASMTRLNAAAARAMVAVGAHAATDVTGFGLIGHAMQLARASKVGARIEVGALPVLPGAWELAVAATLGGAAGRNRQYVGDRLRGEVGAPWLRLAADPQTSGGLLIAVAPSDLAELCRRLEDAGDHAAVIGTLEPADEPGTVELVGAA
jgi:selenide,water dikinase